MGALRVWIVWLRLVVVGVVGLIGFPVLAPLALVLAIRSLLLEFRPDLLETVAPARPHMEILHSPSEVIEHHEVTTQFYTPSNASHGVKQPSLSTTFPLGDDWKWKKLACSLRRP